MNNMLYTDTISCGPGRTMLAQKGKAYVSMTLNAADVNFHITKKQILFVV